MKKALFLCFVFKFSIDHLFDNLESGKRKYCFGKKSAKSLEFWIQNLYEPCTKLSYLRTQHDQGFYEIVQVLSRRSLKSLEDGVLEKLMFRFVIIIPGIWF